jgi:enoyl-CoA hydratase
MMSETFVEYSVGSGWAAITLNRPEKRNAMTHEMAVEIGTLVQRADQDPDVAAILIRGRGSSFCAGFDLSGSAGRSTEPAAVQERISETIWTFHKIWSAAKPVVAQVQGACVGGAFDLMLACDLTICSDDARLGVPEIQFWGGGTMYFSLPWIVGAKTAKYLLLTGIKVTAEQALNMQLVNEVVPLASLEARVASVMNSLAALPEGCLPPTKAAINRAYELQGLVEGVRLGLDTCVLRRLIPGPARKAWEAEVAEVGVREAVARRQHLFT